MTNGCTVNLTDNRRNSRRNNKLVVQNISGTKYSRVAMTYELQFLINFDFSSRIMILIRFNSIVSRLRADYWFHYST